MSTQPSQPFVARQSDFPDPDDREVASGSTWSPVPLILAITVLVLGALLGVANQSADETSMILRVPALLAALLMVGQGAVDIKRNMRPKRRTVTPSHTRTVDQRGQTVREAPRATVRDINQRTPVSAAAVKPTAANLSVPVTVMILSAWLGLADLRVPDAPVTLSVLSLIAAFALFALAWSLLPARR